MSIIRTFWRVCLIMISWLRHFYQHNLVFVYSSTRLGISSATLGLRVCLCHPSTSSEAFLLIFSHHLSFIFQFMHSSVFSLFINYGLSTFTLIKTILTVIDRIEFIVYLNKYVNENQLDRVSPKRSVNSSNHNLWELDIEIV